MPNYSKLSKAELLAEQERLCTDPVNRNIAGGLYLYTKEAQKKLDKIAWAITILIKEEKKARGEFVNEAGYSGRMTNRR